MSLSVIHLSDIHFKNTNNKILERINSLKTACASVIPSNSHVILAVSGDIAFSGEKEQYKKAEEFIKQILDYIKEEKNSSADVVCVPGNHDCKFGIKDNVRQTLVNAVTPEVLDETYYATLLDVQENFVDFANIYGIDFTQTMPSKEITIGNEKILFLLANTAWMSTLEETPGNIIMPVHLFPQEISPSYKIIFFMAHHPINWLNPDYKNSYTGYIRSHADIVLLGHEHAKDTYSQTESTFNLFFNHGKELQDGSNEESAFTVFSFDNTYQTYTLYDFSWSNDKYVRTSEKSNQYHKNIATTQNAFNPNTEFIRKINDPGITISHFAKDEVLLKDIFVCPTLNRYNYKRQNGACTKIKSDFSSEFSEKPIIIITGNSCCGKTALAKFLYLKEEIDESSCLLINGSRFTASSSQKIISVIEDAFCEQYSKKSLEDFRQLSRKKKKIIIDDFDLIKNTNERRTKVLDYLCDNFHQVIIFVSSSLEIAQLLGSRNISIDELNYYEIIPFGNTKRHELIEKWYNLGNNNSTDEEIDEHIESAQQLVNTLLGNSGTFIPATPLYLISVLQNNDANATTYEMSKYGFLYESLIVGALSKISNGYASSGDFDIDASVLSKLAFDILSNKSACFTENDIKVVVDGINKANLLNISYESILDRMKRAQLIFEKPGEKDTYKFKYPYIYYYFSGRYIANHLNEPSVKQLLEYMSSKLYNESYGNIVIFVCHFANIPEVIDDVLLNAYLTLENYEPFDFSKSSPIFDEIAVTVSSLIPTTVAKNDDVNKNKKHILDCMDEAGINDGHVTENPDSIDDSIAEKEKDLAAVSSALKTMQVLGQILKNYPVKINGDKKIDIIKEIHDLGMRTVQATVKSMGYLEQDLIELIYNQVSKKSKIVGKNQVEQEVHKFINVFVISVARSMINQVSSSLNSPYLLEAAKQTYTDSSPISSQLVLLDLQMNSLNSFNFKSIQRLKDKLDSNNEIFASRILDSIVSYYLNYHTCDHALRAQLCSLCHFSEHQAITSSQNYLSN